MFNKLEADALFLRGEYEAAAKMFLEGARDGDELAAFNYGYCLWRGIGVPKNAEAAKSYFVFAKNMQGGEACYNLAMLYLHGEGVKCNYKLSFGYMCDAAELGCVEAMLYLGMVYTTGAMFEPDIIGISMLPFHKTEYRDFSMPVLDGYVPDFEEDEERRYSVVAPDAREAFLYFRKASRQDSTYTAELVAKGKFLYAKCFLDGLGVDFDLKRGVRLMLAAGKSGSADAVAFLGEHGISPEMFLGEGRKHED